MRRRATFMFGKRSCAVAAVSASAIATQLACPGYSWAATERAAASPATSENPGAIAPSPEVAVSSPMDGAAFSAVSVTSRGAGPGYEPSVSSDGHYVAFVDYSGHIYVTDTETDTPTPGVLVDAGSGGAQANKYAFAPVISGSGRYVTFASWATNLLADGAGDGVFQRDLQTGTTVRLSVDGSGAPIDADPVAGVPGPVYAGPGGADPVNGPASSSDGGVVAFVLDDPACDNFTYDVVDYTGNEIAVPMADGGDGYVWDRRTGTATRLPGCVRAPAVSGNGSFVAYDTADASGVFHVYGWDTATSASAGELSVDAAGLVISGRTPSVSEDGRYVAFVTGAVAGNEQGDLRGGTVVVRDRVAGTTKLARHPNEDAAFGADIASAPRLSADGRYVTFAEASRLFCSGAISASGSIPTASFGGEIYAGACGPYFSSGVYVADMRTGTFARMDLDESLAPLAPGRGCSDCYFDGEPSISSDGRYVAFAGIGRFGSGDDGAYLRDRTQTPVFVPSAELRGDDYFCPVCQSSKTRLDPINTATGAYQRQDNDVTPAGGGLGFSLERDYSSDDTNVGLFGTGWASNLGTSLTVLPSGDARVTSGTGAVVAFAREADGSYLAPPEVRATLAALPTGGWQLNSTNQMMTTFDPSGRMVTQVDRHEQGLSYGYDASGRLVTVADASGRSAALTYGAAGPGAGLVTSVALSDGRTWTYTYAFAGDGTSPLLTSVTDPAASTTKYLYDPTAKDLTEVVDGNGHAIASISYGGGQVTSLTEAANTGGTHGTYSWRGGDDGTGTATTTDANGGEWTDVYVGNNLVAETNPLNQTTRYRYDDHNNRTAVIQPDGATTSYTYDAAGNALTKTDPLGDTTTYTYDADNNLTSQTDPLGHTTTYTYDAAGNRSGETDAAGGAWLWIYDPQGRRTSQTDPDGGVTGYTYDAAGDELTSTDPLGNTTSYTYDAAGDELTSTDPLGNTTTYTYDSAGRVLSEIDPLGRKTTSSYDAAGNKTSMTTAAGTSMAATTTYTYDAADRLVTTTDPLGHVTTSAYDNVGNLISTTDPNGDTTTFTYDLANRKISQTTPDGNAEGADPAPFTTTYIYDNAGRLTGASQTFADGATVATSTDYNAAGQATSTTDTDGNTTTNTYDADGNLTQVTDPAGAVTTYGYDALNRKTSQTDPLGRVTTYDYDAAGRLLSTEDPAGDTTTYSYDADGRKLTQTVPNGNTAGANPADYTTHYGYDADGRLTSVTDPLLHTTTTAYDADGEKTSVTDPTGAVTHYTYDSAGNVATTTAPDGSTITNSFDLAGRKTATADAAGHTTAYTYDDAGRLLSSTDPSGATTSYAYDADGNQVTATSPNGGVTKTSYDPLGRVTSTTDPTGGVTSYGFDPAGRQTAQTDGDGNTTTYGYDADGRLTATSRPDGTTLTRVYDAAGQLTSYIDAQGAATTYTYDAAGRLATQTDPDSRTTSYGYDADGNQTTLTDAAGRVTTQTFDAADHLVGVAYSDGVTPNTTYTYDAAGRRASMVDGTGMTGYTYNAAGQLTAVTSTSTNGGTGRTGADDCSICLLSPTAAPAVSASGAASVTSSGAITVDSTASGAITASGSAQITGVSVYTAGTVSASGAATVTPTAIAGTASDPLASAPTPTLTGTPAALNVGGSKSATAQPGVYSSLTASGNASLTLAPGVYVIAGGNVTLSGSARLRGDGVTLYLACAGYPAPCAGARGAGIALSGAATLTLNAAATGQPVTVYADRTSTAAIAASGGAQASVNGGVYAAHAAVSATGNAILSVAGPLVASTAAVTGSAKIAETASPSAPAQPTTSTIGYSYDGLGQVSGVTYADGHAVSRAYDPTGRLSSVTDWSGTTIEFGYDGDGNLVSTTYPGGVVDTTTPDAADRPATITTTRSGTTLAKFGYTYTPGGLLASTTDSLTGQTPQTFGHNTLNQLTDVGGQPSAYSYDAGDNITTLDDGTTLTYDPANQLTGVTKPGGQTQTFGYDAVGDRTTQTGDTTATYSYDQAQRLVSSQAGTGSVTYTYNGDGLRVGEKTAAVQVGFTWDVNAPLTLLLSDATNDYIYGPTDSPVEQVGHATGEATFLHADRLGSVRALTDATGALVGTASYDPYGATSARTGATTPFGYAGQYTDPTGLIYLRARYYDPTTAQFLTVDPAYGQTGARYSYANRDPIDAADPSGLYPVPSGPDGGCFYATDGCSTGTSTGAGACPAGMMTIQGTQGPICVTEATSPPTSIPTVMPHPGDPGLPTPGLPCGFGQVAGTLDQTLTQLNAIYGSTQPGAEAARRSVSDAARLLRTSPDPEVRSAAGKVLAKLGTPTKQLITNPAIKNAERASLVAGVLLDVAQYSMANDSVVEIVSKTALDAAGGFVGGLTGELLAGVVCPAVGLPDAGLATVLCEGAVGFGGAYLGSKGAAKLADLMSKVVWADNGLPALTGNVILVLPKPQPGPAPVTPSGGT